MKIGIIGAGKVGTTLGRYLKEHGISVTGYYSRTLESAAVAAEFTKAKVFKTMEALTEASDTLFITTPDGEIGKVWDCIAGLQLSGKCVYHFSGSLSSAVFSGIEDTGAAGASVHPMYAFSDKFTSYLQFHTAFFVAEGQKRAVKEFQNLFGGKLGHRILTIRAEDKMKYHAAAALASNAMLALFYQSQMLLGECGFTEQESRELFAPLVKNNIDAMLAYGAIPSMTGPVERNDVETVREHLAAIRMDGCLENHSVGLKPRDSSAGMASDLEFDQEMKEALYQTYCALGDTLVTMAEKKHEDRNYAELRQVLKGVS